jgi:hypothetical protein
MMVAEKGIANFVIASASEAIHKAARLPDPSFRGDANGSGRWPAR